MRICLTSGSVNRVNKQDWSDPNDAQVAQRTLEGDKIQFWPRYYRSL